MKLKNEFEPIRNWATEKGILSKGDVKTQYIKLQEECGELAKALLNDDKEEIIDALGDCTVVLVNLSALAGYNLEDCINSAYNVIAKRQGKMINGTFIKETK
jgi:NTP pyrophosphatase (non-canonical NTP hydrolase)